MYHYLSAIRKPLIAPKQLTCWLVSDYYISLGNWLILIIFSLSVACKTICVSQIICSVLSASRGSFGVSFKYGHWTTPLLGGLNCFPKVRTMMAPKYWQSLSSLMKGLTRNIKAASHLPSNPLTGLARSLRSWW